MEQIINNPYYVLFQIQEYVILTTEESEIGFIYFQGILEEGTALEVDSEDIRELDVLPPNIKEEVVKRLET